MNYFIVCDSKIGGDVFKDNRKSNFINPIKSLNSDDGGEWFIALTFIKALVSESESDQYNILRVHVDEVARLYGGDNDRDSWIFEITNNSKITKVPYIPGLPVFYPLQRKEINQLSLSIRNESGQEVELLEHCVMTFHLQQNVYPLTKHLRTYSNIQGNIFPNNDPMKYINALPTALLENWDFTQWEIALESVVIEPGILNKIHEFYLRPDCLSIYVNVIKDLLYADRTSKLIALIPMSTKSILFDKVHNKPISTFMYKAYNLTFFPIMVSDLSTIEVTLSFDHVKKKRENVGQTFHFNEEEKIALKDSMCNVNFLLRKKY